MKLDKRDLKVLKICNEEPGAANEISHLSAIDEKNVSKILKKLEKMNLIYCEQDIWSSTVRGQSIN